MTWTHLWNFLKSNLVAGRTLTPAERLALPLNTSLPSPPPFSCILVPFPQGLPLTLASEP